MLQFIKNGKNSEELTSEMTEEIRISLDSIYRDIQTVLSKQSEHTLEIAMIKTQLVAIEAMASGVAELLGKQNEPKSIFYKVFSQEAEIAHIQTHVLDLEKSFNEERAIREAQLKKSLEDLRVEKAEREKFQRDAQIRREARELAERTSHETRINTERSARNRVTMAIITGIFGILTSIVGIVAHFMGAPK